MKFNREKIASIEVVQWVQTIRGAHNIELVQAGGYCSLAPQHLFNEGDRVVVIQRGVMLPRWAEVIGESSGGVYLKRNKYVVKPIRLRGVWSDCLMLHISIVNAIEPELISGGIPVGMDIRHILGVWDEKDPFPVIDVDSAEQNAEQNAGQGAEQSVEVEPVAPSLSFSQSILYDSTPNYTGKLIL